MATIKVNPAVQPKANKAPSIKLPQGRSSSGTTQFRASASSYGKLAKLAGGATIVPKVSK